MMSLFLAAVVLAVAPDGAVALPVVGDDASAQG
jgi:hypothetical protein